MTRKLFIQTEYSLYFACLMIILLTGCSQENIPDSTKTISHNYSKLVYPGTNDRLIYTPDEKGNIIPDFSYAGYMGGGVRLPDVPVKVTVEPGKGDDAARIQEAIEKASAWPVRQCVVSEFSTWEDSVTYRQKSVVNLHHPVNRPVTL